MTTQVAIRIPDSQLAAIDAMVPGRHQSRSEVIRRAVELYLYRLACERDADIYDAVPLDQKELALGEDAAAWEATPLW